MTKPAKTLSVRVDAEDYAFLVRFAAAQKEDISKTARDLLARGRVLLAVERYRSGKASLEKAAEIAGLSITETMDALTELGVEANLEREDYLASLSNLKGAW
jgi:predicted HTH domain antitoxin